MDDVIELYFRNYPPDMRAVAQTLRKLIKSVMPEAYESIYHGASS